MRKISKTIRISPERWGEIAHLAKLKETTPSQWILDAVIGRLEGTLCCVEAHSVSRGTSKAPKKVAPILQLSSNDSVACLSAVEAWKNCGYDIGRIQKLQSEIADARSTYETYLGGLVGEELEIEKKSWYVVEAKDRWDTLQVELDEIVPKSKGDDHGN